MTEQVIEKEKEAAEASEEDEITEAAGAVGDISAEGAENGEPDNDKSEATEDSEPNGEGESEAAEDSEPSGDGESESAEDSEPNGESEAAEDSEPGENDETESAADDGSPYGGVPDKDDGTDGETPEKKGFPLKTVLKISGIVVGVLAALYLAGVAFYNSHFFFNTNIGNFDCSNLSVAAAADRIKTNIGGYSFGIIDKGGAVETVSGADIALAYETMSSLDDLKARQNPFLWFIDYDCRNLPVEIDISYDENALAEKVKSLNCVNVSNSEMAGATSTVYYDENTHAFTASDDGSRPDVVSVSKILDKTKAGIENFYANMNLEAEGCYVGVAEEDNMRQALETMNKYVSTKVTYERGEDSTILDGGSIHNWVSLGDDYSVNIDGDAVRDWVDDLADIYGTVGSARSFVTSYGETITVSGGDYGWLVDSASETDELIELIKNGGESSREPVYKQTAGSHGPNNDLPNTYVEINIGAQHVWFYKDGELAVSTDCVTGDPTKGRSTDRGVYYIKYKERNATLKGEDYETPVSFWMPFNGGQGLHDLSSRGAFGGSIYRGNGSHGCVNLPYWAASSIYSGVERGVPVIVF